MEAEAKNGLAVRSTLGRKQMMPHSGYHWRGQRSRFFEGWYLRLTLPNIAQTFAFMYSIDDPAGGTPLSGGVAQILGPDEVYYCRTFPEVTQFWAWPHQLGLGHWRKTAIVKGRAGCLPPSTFLSEVKEGYQLSAEQHQGRLLKPNGEIQAQWNYQIEPVVSWGRPNPQATAGWLSYLPVFEPGWQVLMAHGWATGWIEWAGEGAIAQSSTHHSPTRYTFERAPAYAEKNWGGAFPSKWFWLQCNAFDDAPGLSITAAGGVRDVLTWQEDVGLIGIHHNDQFYEFLSVKTKFTWTVEPWGYWKLTAQDYRYRVEVIGHATDEGAYVRVPTLEGMQWQCRDTTHGELSVRLWSSKDAQLLIDATSTLAGLEVGGGPWDDRWTFGIVS